jgi:hypothetical protein
MSNQMLKQKLPLLLVAILLVGSMTEVFDSPLGQTFDLSVQLTQKGLDKIPKVTLKEKSHYFDVIVVFHEETQISDYAQLKEVIGSFPTPSKIGGEIESLAAALTLDQIKSLQALSFIKHIEFNSSVEPEMK